MTADQIVAQQIFEAVITDVVAEMQANAHRPVPPDPLRRAAIVAEEAGEVIKAALDFTRGNATMRDGADRIRGELVKELVQTASTAIRVLVAMKEEEGYWEKRHWEDPAHNRRDSEANRRKVIAPWDPPLKELRSGQDRRRQ